MAEYSIPVMFNIEAASRDEAARIIVESLVEARNSSRHSGLSEWWTIDHRDKSADGNDNAPGIVVFWHDLYHMNETQIVQHIYNATEGKD